VKFHITLRVTDHRGWWSLQTKVNADNTYEALGLVLERFGIAGEDLIRIHVQEDDGRDGNHPGP